MFLLIKLSIRNIFRNTRRTILSGIAIGAGLASLIIYDALVIGMKENMVRAATSTFNGQGQIHRKGFRQTYDVEDVIVNSGEVLESLKGERLIRGAAPRTISHAMITSTSDVSSVMLVGIDPEKEKNISKVHEVIEKGNFISPDGRDRILIGKKLAQNLNVGVGDRVVVTVAQANTGELSQEMFRVGGIFFFNINEMDRQMAFINLKESQKLLQIGANVHEIAFNFKDIKLAEKENLELWGKYSRDGNEALGWNLLFDELSSLFKMFKFVSLLSIFLLSGVIALGIMNTLFMSLYERKFEFGVMRAVGTRPFKMALIVVFEACALAIVSILIGMILGYFITYYLSVTGIDYRGLELSGVTIKDMIYPVLTWGQFVLYPIALFIFTAIVGVYPAIYAARLTPAKAMTRSF